MEDVEASGDYEYEYPEGIDEPYKEQSPSNLCSKTCLSIQHCDLSNNISPPDICDWNSQNKNYDVCCNKLKTALPKKNSNEVFYPCEDYHEDCSKWATKYPQSCTNSTHSSFSLMTVGCMKSCKMCSNEKGCVDELEQCQKWSLMGHCSTSILFMASYCRRSCGICGFKSPRNQEIQRVNRQSFTNLNDKDFTCGKDDNSFINENPKPMTPMLGIRNNPIFEDDIEKDLGNLFFYSTDTSNSNRSFFCGSIIINDRFIVTAAHCSHNTFDEITSVLIRDNDDKYREQVEIKRSFIHPYFQYPSLYYDIAVSELGRRILYSPEVNDYPACLSTPDDVIHGLEAKSQGYGFTEKGHTSDVLLESTVSIIENEDCASMLKHNVSKNSNFQTRLKLALNYGINEQLICSLGEHNKETGIYSGPCEGDSGGPLYISKQRGKTLVGIVSGGLGCGKNIPKWYTKISSFYDWIQCIVSNTRIYNNSAKVKNICNSIVINFKASNSLF